MLLGLFVVMTAQACSAQCNRPSPPSRHVSHFRVGPTSVLNALFLLGYDNGVCFGIGYSSSDLNNSVQVDENESTVGEIAKKILGPSFLVAVSQGIILIRKREQTPPCVTLVLGASKCRRSTRPPPGVGTKAGSTSN